MFGAGFGFFRRNDFALTGNKLAKQISVLIINLPCFFLTEIAGFVGVIIFIIICVDHILEIRKEYP